MGAAVGVAALATACGSGGPVHLSPAARAHRLLRQAFRASDGIDSGKLGLLGLYLQLTPAGSAHGPSSSMSVVSAGAAGVITVDGGSYPLSPPDAEKLVIHPQDWVIAPRVVGSGSLDGVATTRIHAGVDVPRLLADASGLLSRASSQKLASAVQDLADPGSAPTQPRGGVATGARGVDIWIGAAHRRLRRLDVSLEIPVGGQRAAAGGGGSLAVALTLRYSANRPRTLVGRADRQPYSAIAASAQAIAQGLQTGTIPEAKVPPVRKKPSSSANPAATELTLSPYAQCIANAAGNGTKMQACASLSNDSSPSPTGSG